MQRLIGKYISIISRNTSSHFRKSLSHLKIGDGQYIILIQLFKNNSLTQEKLSEILSVDKATITRGVQALAKNGYLYVEKNVNDRRENIIQLTSKAHSIKEEFFSIIKKWNSIIIDELDESEKEILFNSLEKIANKVVLLNRGDF